MTAIPALGPSSANDSATSCSTVGAVSIFFFQAEDGIRAGRVTGVQTCALPILGGVITFAVSLLLACMMLRWRCRGIGPPFGPRARYWAWFIVLATASVSAVVGVLFLAGGHVPAYIGILDR